MNELKRICHLCPRSALCLVEGAWQSQLDLDDTLAWEHTHVECQPWWPDGGVKDSVLFYIRSEDLDDTEKVQMAV